MSNPNYLIARESDPEAIAAVASVVSDKDKVILYFHGGLSSPEYVEEDLGPELLLRVFRQKWFPNSHVCFVQYEASLFSWDALKSIANEILSETAEGKLRKWISDHLGLDSKAHGLVASSDEIISERAANLLSELRESPKHLPLVQVAPGDEEDFPSDKDVEGLSKTLLSRDGTVADLDLDLSARIEARTGVAKAGFSGAAGFFAKALVRSLWRISKGTHHQYFETAIEEILRGAIAFDAELADIAQGHWKMVKAHAKEAWESPNSNGFQLLNILATEAAKRPAGKPLRVDLMCHSAGSLALCAAIDALARERAVWPNFKFGTLLFVAPAVQIKVFQKSIVDRAGKGFFDRFRMYTLTEDAESADHLAWYLYANSLLYFVSGVAEEDGGGDMTILGLERHFRQGKHPYNKKKYYSGDYQEVFGDLGRIRDFLAEPGHVVLSPNDATSPGERADATGHENSKRPFKSPKLAASVVHVLTGGKFSPTADEMLKL